MTYLKPYKKFNTFIQNESFEPLVSWGIRMAISGSAPIIWGLATGHIDDAVWIALTAEGISWVEMKGSFNWRVRTLFLGSLLALLWGVLGTISGDSLLLSMALMFVAGFSSSLLKNLGDRASGLAICVYLLFIICNAYPEKQTADVQHRLMLILIGTAWPFAVGVFASLLMPVQQPFRRQIAIIWRSIFSLADSIARNAGNIEGQREVFQREKQVREAIDKSFEFYGKMAHQANRNDKHQYQLLQLRKNAALVSVNLITIAEEIEYIDIASLDSTLRIKAATMLNALKEAISRIAVYVLTLKAEEKLLAITQIKRVLKLTALLRDYHNDDGSRQSVAINRILQLVGRTLKLMESAITRIADMEDDKPVFRSYSMMKTLFLLRPGKIASNVRTLMNFDSLSIRFALRTAIAATLALFMWQYFHIDHGYWIPFSLMIVIQPYFGATLKKAIDRVAGTILGGISGGLLALIPTDLHVKEGMLFLTFILMVYYVRKNYAIAAFIVTLNLVLLFNIDHTYNYHLLLTRAGCTVVGSLLAVIAGFALLPDWDKKWLPTHIAEAIKSSYNYFIDTFYGEVNNWTKNKRIAESKNSNVFDSFSRYMAEPGSNKREEYYDIVTCNVRIVRDLNNINLEQEEKTTIESRPGTVQLTTVEESLTLFHEILELLQVIHPDLLVTRFNAATQARVQFLLNETQMISLEKLRIELKTMKADLKELVADLQEDNRKSAANFNSRNGLTRSTNA